MTENMPEAAVAKPAFEPSDFIDYGDADELTRGSHSSPNAGDGDYTS
jgi:hypothetical protein